MPVSFLPYIIMSWQLQHVLQTLRIVGRSWDTQGRVSIAHSCHARPGLLFGTATLGLICSDVMGQGRGQIPSQSGFQSQRWQCRLRVPKLSSCYHNNMAHPLQSRHSMPGVQRSAVALTRFTFILFLYYLLFGIEKEHSHWVFWHVLPPCPKTPGCKAMECPGGTVLLSYFEDLENKCIVCAWTENTYKKQFSISESRMSQLFFWVLIIVSNRKYCWGFNSVVSP